VARESLLREGGGSQGKSRGGLYLLGTFCRVSLLSLDDGLGFTDDGLVGYGTWARKGGLREERLE
jgi:hypothetical protein